MKTLFALACLAALLGCAAGMRQLSESYDYSSTSPHCPPECDSSFLCWEWGCTARDQYYAAADADRTDFAKFVATWMAVFMKEKDDPDCTSKLCDQARSVLKATPDSDDTQFACLKFFFLDGYCTMQLSSEGIELFGSMMDAVGKVLDKLGDGFQIEKLLSTLWDIASEVSESILEIMSDYYSTTTVMTTWQNLILECNAD